LRRGSLVQSRNAVRSLPDIARYQSSRRKNEKHSGHDGKDGTVVESGILEAGKAGIPDVGSEWGRRGKNGNLDALNCRCSGAMCFLTGRPLPMCISRLLAGTGVRRPAGDGAVANHRPSHDLWLTKSPPSTTVGRPFETSFTDLRLAKPNNGAETIQVPKVRAPTTSVVSRLRFPSPPLFVRPTPCPLLRHMPYIPLLNTPLPTNPFSQDRARNN